MATEPRNARGHAGQACGQEKQRNRRMETSLFHVISNIFTPLYSWKRKSVDHLAKTTLAHGAYSQFQNLLVSVLHFSEVFREQEWITERGTSSARTRADSTLSDFLWSGLVWSAWQLLVKTSTQCTTSIAK